MTYFVYATATYHKIGKELLKIFDYKVLRNSMNIFIYPPKDIIEELKKGKELFYIGRTKKEVEKIKQEADEYEFDVDIIKLNKKKPIYYALY